MKQTQQKEYCRKAALYQQLALPIKQNIEIAENEPVFVANAQLEELDYREPHRAYSPKGRKSAAEPRIMFMLLVYGYMCGIYSTRKLEQACRKNIDFIWLLQGERVPDHSSFARFRSGKARQAIEDLFHQFVKRLAAEQEIEYEEVFIDRTKIESMANRYTFVWRKSVDKQPVRVKEKARELFYRYGGKGKLTTGKLRSLATSLVPEGEKMVHGTGRRKPLWQRQYEEIDHLLERWKKYEAQLFEMGCRRYSLSKAEKDATFMRMKEDHMGNGQLKSAYNVQLAVNSEYITGVAAFPNCTDSGTLVPFLNHIQRMQGRSYRDIVADAGYESVGNYLYLQAHGQNCYIKPTNYEVRKTKKYRQQIAMDAELTRYGGVETREEGRLYAKWLKEHEGQYDGVIFSMPIFADENGAITALQDAGVPILMQAYPDEIGKMDFKHRRDAYCGKFSVTDECTVHIYKSLIVLRDYDYQLTTTKESDDRYVDVAPEYMEFMKKYYKIWKSKKKCMGASWQTDLESKRERSRSSIAKLKGNNFVICDDHGWPLHPDGYNKIVKSVGQKAGIGDLHPHMFRHTFVSLLMSNPDIGVATVAAEAGHTQPSTTLMIYTQQYKKRWESIRNQLSRELYPK